VSEREAQEKTTWVGNRGSWLKKEKRGDNLTGGGKIVFLRKGGGSLPPLKKRGE